MARRALNRGATDAVVQLTVREIYLAHAFRQFVLVYAEFIAKERSKGLAEDEGFFGLHVGGVELEGRFARGSLRGRGLDRGGTKSGLRTSVSKMDRASFGILNAGDEPTEHSADQA